MEAGKSRKSAKSKTKADEFCIKIYSIGWHTARVDYWVFISETRCHVFCVTVIGYPIHCGSDAYIVWEVCLLAKS